MRFLPLAFLGLVFLGAPALAADTVPAPAAKPPVLDNGMYGGKDAGKKTDAKDEGADTRPDNTGDTLPPVAPVPGKDATNSNDVPSEFPKTPAYRPLNIRPR
jgi:hypothetical protein